MLVIHPFYLTEHTIACGLNYKAGFFAKHLSSH